MLKIELMIIMYIRIIIMSFFRNTAAPQPCITTGYVAPLCGQFKLISAGSPLNLYNRLSSFVGRFNMAPFSWLFNPSRCPADTGIYECCNRRPLDANASALRAAAMGTAAADAIRAVATPTRILDIGCGDASISLQIGTLLDISTDNIFGIDLMPADTHIAINNYVQYDGINMPEGVRHNHVFDCCLIQQVLHHVADIPKFMSELDYVLAPGGIVFIKEHHIQNAYDMMMVDVEHMLYKIHGGSDEQGDFKVRNYKSASDWDAIFSNYERITGDWFFADPKNMRISATKTYYMIYKKPATAANSTTIVVPPLLIAVNTMLDTQVQTIINRMSVAGPRRDNRGRR